MEKQKLPDTELKVMQAIWHIESPASTSAVREELQKERPGTQKKADWRRAFPPPSRILSLPLIKPSLQPPVNEIFFYPIFYETGWYKQ